MSTGRKPVLDESCRREIVALLSAGIGRRAAAHYVGCAPNTICNTMRRDADFARQVRRAELHWELGLLHTIRQAAQRGWRARAWLQERTMPHDYGRRAPDQVTPEESAELIDELVDEVLAFVPRERRADLRRGVAAIVDEQADDGHARPPRRARKSLGPAGPAPASALPRPEASLPEEGRVQQRSRK